jgi:hypothetical protein
MIPGMLIGSQIVIDWTWDPAEFRDERGCCCCKEIGFVQTVKSRATWQLGFKQNAWVLDSSIPYPHGETANPCSTSVSTRISMSDSPSAWSFFYGSLKSLEQHFVTCVV